MIFSSWQFIFAFLPIAFFVYFALLRARLVVGAKLWLVAASLFFYGYWNVAYLPLILGSMGGNYLVGTALARGRQGLLGRCPKLVSRKVILVLGVSANLLLLGYFKYSDFFLANANALFGTSFPLPGVILPLAISFFTFQQIAYLADS